MDQVATREEGECCNVGAACRTYQDLRFSDADESLPVLGLVHERIVKRKRARFTTTSKILHMSIPELFVMCDAAIRDKYGCNRCHSRVFVFSGG